MNSKKLSIALPILITLLVTTVGIAVIFMTRDITMTASVKTMGTVGVYSDSGCTIEVNSYAWLEFDPSTGQHNKTLNLWLKNLGNVPINVSWIMTDANLVWTNVISQYFVSNAWEYKAYKDQTLTALWYNANSTDNGLKYVTIAKASTLAICLNLKAVSTADPLIALDFITTFIASSTT